MNAFQYVTYLFTLYILFYLGGIWKSIHAHVLAGAYAYQMSALTVIPQEPTTLLF